MSQVYLSQQHTSIKKNFICNFTLTINLPDTTIDTIPIESLDEMFNDYLRDKDIQIDYVCSREYGDSGEESSTHYHIWCNPHSPIRRDAFIDSYLIPLLSRHGFSKQAMCTEQHIYKCSKVRKPDHHLKISYGYIFKDIPEYNSGIPEHRRKNTGRIMMDCLFRNEKRLLQLRERFGSPLLDRDKFRSECVNYSDRHRNLSYRDPHEIDPKCISEVKTLRWLKNFGPPEMNNAEKIFIAFQQGYEMMCLKKSVRFKQTLNYLDKIYIYQLMDVDFDEWAEKVQQYYDYLERKSRKRKRE